MNKTAAPMSRKLTGAVSRYLPSRRKIRGMLKIAEF